MRETNVRGPLRYNPARRKTMLSLLAYLYAHRRSSTVLIVLRAFRIFMDAEKDRTEIDHEFVGTVRETIEV